MPNYDSSNQAFLQAFMARGSMTFEDARPILAAIKTANNAEGHRTRAEDISEEQFNVYIRTANSALQQFDLSILSTKSQKDQTKIFAFVNNISDSVTQLSTVHSVEEIAFLKRVLEAMFDTYNVGATEIMAITPMQALRYTVDPDAPSATSGVLTKTQAEKYLTSMVEEGWFLMSRKGYLSLSPRALIELQQWLIDTFNTADEDGDEPPPDRIKFCHGCKNIITEGQRCAKRSCLCRIHDRCQDGVFRLRRGERVCPLCDTEWTGQDFVGEKAARSSASASNGRRARESRREEPPTSRVSNARIEDQEDSEDDDIYD